MRGGWWGEDWEGQDSGQGGCKYLMQYALMYWNICKITSGTFCTL